jgi:mannosylglycoprotein endo-beta-mannosidase
MKIQKLIYDFYRELMGTEDFYPITLVQGIWTEGQCASQEDNDSLIRSFLPEELDQVLKETKTNTAPGPDGFPVIFFKSFWSLVKPLVLQLLNGFALGVIDISRLNFGILSLIPKVPGADDIKQFRPIALINVIFKLVSKAYAIRLAPIAHRVISTSQSAFIKGRLIHEGALALHEIVHELKIKKTRAVILKLDFEKAYDRVSWAFLRDVLVCKGFESGVVHRLMQLVTGGQTAISINGKLVLTLEIRGGRVRGILFPRFFLTSLSTLYLSCWIMLAMRDTSRGLCPIWLLMGLPTSSTLMTRSF